MSYLFFYDDTFPYDGVRPSQHILSGLTDQVVNAEQLADALASGHYQTFVNLHGSYFPKDVWSLILTFLQGGGGLVHTGDIPFRKPVYKEQGEWKVEVEQTAYHQQLNIHEALEVTTSKVEQQISVAERPLLEDLEDAFSIQPTYGFVLHPTKEDDQPHENGSSGPMDAHIYPLLKGLTSDGRDISAPVVLIENTKGVFAGGRWIFLNQRLDEQFWKMGEKVLTTLAWYAAEGVTEIWLKPGYASYYPQEVPSLSIQLQSLSLQHKKSEGKQWTFELHVLKEGSNEILYQEVIALDESKEWSWIRRTLPFQVEEGFYTIHAKASSTAGEISHFHQGFWGFSESLLQEGSPLVAKRDYFEKDGKPFPIVGMTYMTSDVARKFLFMPNAMVWDQDMEQMKHAGINHIRSGIWTAWRQIMYVDGHPYEEVLRAIDAFVLTAKKHDLDLCFTFFAFTPELWEGKNPYLDPRSVEAQKRFIAAITSRYTQATHLHWDLINEPSMFDPKRIFSGPKSARDPFEIKAFQEWVKEKYQTIRQLQEAWNYSSVELPDFSAVTTPEAEDMNFDVQDMRNPSKSLVWLDYTLFTMDMHNRWAAELSTTIHETNPGRLITVGQDEALVSQRPTPFFYESVVDYTTNHTWWQQDHLVWDGVFTKTANKPNLVQETGIMYLEQPDGMAKRSEEELRNILERKYAYAFSTGGAGAVQWLWNTNFYMNNVNESNIGALRADGTEKPEADVSYDFGAFMNESKDLFVNRSLEEVAVVYPYSNDFSSRKLAFEATSKTIRTLSYEMNTHARGFGEYHLDELLENQPKLVIVPSAHNFSDEAFDKLIAYAEQGGTVLYTGPLRLNAGWKESARLVELGATERRNVLREEALVIDGKSYPVSFGARRIAELTKETLVESTRNEVISTSIGDGQFIWSPLPIELNNRLESVIALYAYALNQAGVSEELIWSKGAENPGIYGRRLSYDQGDLYIFVSEFAGEAEIEVTNPENNQSYSFVMEEERSILFRTNKQGDVISVYRPKEVKIEAGIVNV
ncbi:beta-galactosidase [Alkalicoccobacillus porphyridii]|uniref:Cellulase family glycosylhydrolase n=1 Tax=Alkalicoccobacillus porphyridii TaxID=2597270 RepID=A0A554A3L2_9BACI|nr:beta-galactosidase [Alkalicoccobacillus porphyridii]TSB48265.1 cellulase family glycosylhydrolase [Alkalicoccobacillus porphyridii]